MKKMQEYGNGRFTVSPWRELPYGTPTRVVTGQHYGMKQDGRLWTSGSQLYRNRASSYRARH